MRLAPLAPFALVLAATGCGGAQTPSAAPRAPEPDSEPERFTVELGSSLSVDGEELTLAGWRRPESERGPFAVSLSRADGRSIDVGHPGCTRSGDWVWTLDAMDPGEPEQAHLARARASRDRRSIAWAEPFETSARETLDGGDGWTIRMGALRMLSPSYWALELVAQRGDERFEQTIDVQRDHAREQPLGRDHLVTALTTERTDPVGCPVVRLRIDNPSAHVVDAHEGEEVELQARWRVRVGEVAVRFDGWGQLRLADGTEVGLAMLELEPDGAGAVRDVCTAGEQCRVGGWIVRVADAAGGRARVSIRRAD